MIYRTFQKSVMIYRTFQKSVTIYRTFQKSVATYRTFQKTAIFFFHSSLSFCIFLYFPRPFFLFCFIYSFLFLCPSFFLHFLLSSFLDFLYYFTLPVNPMKAYAKWKQSSTHSSPQHEISPSGQLHTLAALDLNARLVLTLQRRQNCVFPVVMETRPDPTRPDPTRPDPTQPFYRVLYLANLRFLETELGKQF